MSNEMRAINFHGHICRRCGNNYECKSSASCRMGREVDDCGQCYGKIKVDGAWVPKPLTKFE